MILSSINAGTVNPRGIVSLVQSPVVDAGISHQNVTKLTYEGRE